MLFNTFHYASFFLLVFLLYWLAAGKNRMAQNVLLLAASYFFYGFWDVRFLGLLIFSTLLDYGSGILMEKVDHPFRRKLFLTLSIGINLGFLAVFKYYDFFISSFASLLEKAGITFHPTLLEWILPVGISFYTFHGLSYVLDVYNRKIKACYSPIDYSLFVSFFPLLVAGPIERAHHLLPQIQSNRIFNADKARDGLRQILWGLFKKVVIADVCATQVNTYFADPTQASGAQLALAVFLFTIQIYGDFSGYSDIALGSARLLGFELLQNFSFPYFSRDIAEFWRRWHISLTTWFRDYVYIPLGGSRVGKTAAIRNTFIVFLLSGLWHGANWTFLVWGAWNALLFLPLLLLNKNRSNLDMVGANQRFPSIKELASILLTFVFVAIGWTFFRATNVEQAFFILKKITTEFGTLDEAWMPTSLLVLITMLFTVEWLGRHGRYALEKMPNSIPVYLRWSFYLLVIGLMFTYRQNAFQFIYFQF